MSDSKNPHPEVTFDVIEMFFKVFRYKYFVLAVLLFTAASSFLFARKKIDQQNLAGVKPGYEISAVLFFPQDIGRPSYLKVTPEVLASSAFLDKLHEQISLGSASAGMDDWVTRDILRGLIDARVKLSNFTLTLTHNNADADQGRQVLKLAIEHIQQFLRALPGTIPPITLDGPIVSGRSGTARASILFAGGGAVFIALMTLFSLMVSIVLATLWDFFRQVRQQTKGLSHAKK